MRMRLGCLTVQRGSDHKMRKTRSTNLVLGALFLFFVAGALQRYGFAQSGTSTGSPGAPRTPGQNPNGMHVYLWAGLKSHLPGQHDYPQFLADWSKVLTEHG